MKEKYFQELLEKDPEKVRMILGQMKRQRDEKFLDLKQKLKQETLRVRNMDEITYDALLAFEEQRIQSSKTR